MLDVACPACGETYHISQEHVGKSLRCRRCGRVFALQPAADGSAAGTTAAATARTAGSTGGSAPPRSAPRSAAPGAAPSAAAGGSAHPITVTDRDFAQTVLASPRPVLVDFWAPWCGPCRALAPAIEQLAQEYGGRVTFVKLNTDENQATMARYGVMGLPTLVLFKGGREAGRLVGLQPKANIKRALDQVA